MILIYAPRCTRQCRSLVVSNGIPLRRSVRSWEPDRYETKAISSPPGSACLRPRRSCAASFSELLVDRCSTSSSTPPERHDTLHSVPKQARHSDVSLKRQCLVKAWIAAVSLRRRPPAWRQNRSTYSSAVCGGDRRGISDQGRSKSTSEEGLVDTLGSVGQQKRMPPSAPLVRPHPGIRLI
jgi:hypothetical protein